MDVSWSMETQFSNKNLRRAHDGVFVIEAMSLPGSPFVAAQQLMRP